MTIKIVKKEHQAKGSFDGGLILENKPIGFPQDGGTQKPYSNLFYWANVWSDNGGLIGEHPHQLFEIMSFVIEGEIQHYDNKFNRWLSLTQGDAQIIRAGNGIRHAEKIVPGGRMFQIWFDPNVKLTYNKPSSYNDYKNDAMHYVEENGLKIKNYTGNGGPIQMDSEGVVISEITIPKGETTFLLSDGKITSFYLLNNELLVNNEPISEHDFTIIENEKSIQLFAKEIVKIFLIEVPQQLSYKTYLELNNR